MERAKIAIWYDVCGSVVEVQRKFRAEFEPSNAHKPSTIPQLKSLIDHSVQEIGQDIIDRSLIEFKNRLQKCFEMDGRHIENC